MTPLYIHNYDWELMVAAGQPHLRLLFGGRWWVLPLSVAGSSRARRIAYETMSRGGAVPESLQVYRRPSAANRIRECSQGDERRPPRILCRLVVWFPRDAVDGLAGSPLAPGALGRRLNSSAEEQSIVEIDNGNLRKAIRANRISFPSRVPAFMGSPKPDLETRLVQLYFVLGWNYVHIAARYGLTEAQVRHILNAWKCRAARAGYLEHLQS